MVADTKIQAANAVADKYSELTHYTSAAGLTGILATQSLWATHASFLNDAEEIKLFFDRRLAQIIEEELNSASQPSDPASVRIVAAQFAASIRKVTLAFNQAYIFSMCATTNERTARNGLLSQWRGYGKDGGYAIVFDTKGLENRLTQENDMFHYQHMQWGDVHYYDASSGATQVAPEILEAESNLRAGISAFARDPSPDVMQSTYVAVTTLSCLYKHWGFAEECEVRVIAIPAHSTIRAATISDQETVKIPKTYVRDGCPVPYIELFAPAPESVSRALLPIRRVIVGPHRDRQQRKEAVELILEELGMKATVEVSEIPYIGK